VALYSKQVFTGSHEQELNAMRSI